MVEMANFVMKKWQKEKRNQAPWDTESQCSLGHCLGWVMKSWDLLAQSRDLPARSWVLPARSRVLPVQSQEQVDPFVSLNFTPETKLHKASTCRVNEWMSRHYLIFYGCSFLHPLWCQIKWCSDCNLASGARREQSGQKMPVWSFHSLAVHCKNE